MGLGLLLMDAEPKRGPQPGQFFALTAMMVSLLAVIGYIVHLGIYYGETSQFPGTRMARMTTACFLILGTGVLCARPRGRVMRVLTSRTDGGGAVLRRLLLLPVIVPLAVGMVLKSRCISICRIRTSMPGCTRSAIFLFSRWYSGGTGRCSIRLDSDGGKRQKKRSAGGRRNSNSASRTRRRNVTPAGNT